MISEQLKQAMTESGKTPYQIAVESGVPQSVVSRFLSEKPDQHRDIRLEGTADKLAAYFGLELRPPDPTAAKSKVKAPAVPAVDWSKTKPAKKQKAEPAPGPGPAKPIMSKRKG